MNLIAWDDTPATTNKWEHRSVWRVSFSLLNSRQRETTGHLKSRQTRHSQRPSTLLFWLKIPFSAYCSNSAYCEFYFLDIIHIVQKQKLKFIKLIWDFAQSKNTKFKSLSLKIPCFVRPAVHKPKILSLSYLTKKGRKSSHCLPFLLENILNQLNDHQKNCLWIVSNNLQYEYYQLIKSGQPEISRLFTYTLNLMPYIPLWWFTVNKLCKLFPFCKLLW